MRVKDSKEKTICIVQFFDEIVNERNFLTLNIEEMQFASFKYKKETEIKRIFKLDHHHIGDKKSKGVSTQ